MTNNILTHFNEIKAKGLSIDITRGKPDSSQLDPVSYTHLRAHET